MSPKNLTVVLNRASRGDRAAQEEVFRHVEQQLRKLAAEQMRRERPGHSLQTSILVNDAFMNLVGNGAEIDWNDRNHFYRLAARAMRRILVDHERRRRAQKRGDGPHKVHLSDNFPATVTEPSNALLDLDEALTLLEEFAPRQGEIVQMHHFGGYTLDECAKMLDVSLSTIKVEWSAARAWLHKELTCE